MMVDQCGWFQAMVGNLTLDWPLFGGFWSRVGVILGELGTVLGVLGAILGASKEDQPEAVPEAHAGGGLVAGGAGGPL